MLLSGDDDEAGIKAIPMSRNGGYDLYELVSSPLAQDPKADYSEANDKVIAIEEPNAESMNFGTLTFDMTERIQSYSASDQRLWRKRFPRIRAEGKRANKH